MINHVASLQEGGGSVQEERHEWRSENATDHRSRNQGIDGDPKIPPTTDLLISAKPFMRLVR